MKKYVRWFVAAAVFCVSLFFALWIFFPWKDAGVWCLDGLRSSAVSKGMYVDFGKVERTGFLKPEITVNDVSFRYLMGRLDVEKIGINPKPLTSLLHMEPCVSVMLRKGAVFTGNDKRADFARGSMTIRGNAERMFVDRIDFSGGLTASGHAVVDLAKATLSSASKFQVRWRKS